MEQTYTLARQAVCKHIPVSERGLADLIANDPTFPKPVMLGGPRSSRWIRTEIEAWIASRPRRVAGDEPSQLTAARAAKAAGRTPAPAPFDGATA